MCLGWGVAIPVCMEMGTTDLYLLTPVYPKSSCTRLLPFSFSTCNWKAAWEWLRNEAMHYVYVMECVKPWNIWKSVALIGVWLRLQWFHEAKQPLCHLSSLWCTTGHFNGFKLIECACRKLYWTHQCPIPIRCMLKVICHGILFTSVECQLAKEQDSWGDILWVHGLNEGS